MRYIPNTPDDREAMLREIGVSSFEELLTSIPRDLRLKRSLRLPAGKSELEVKTHLIEVARESLNASLAVSYVGGGSYDHYVPSAVNAVASRSEFVTAYTPYQPEVAQGTLQVIYEFQSMICELFGMDVANASLYDAGTGLAEAVLLATGATRRNKIIVPESVHPLYRQVSKTLTVGIDTQYIETPCVNGVTSVESIETELSDEIAAVVLPCPNFFGVIEDFRGLIEKAHAVGALAVVIADPMAMGILEAPGRWGADVVIGEGQGLGNPQSFGGPFLGLFAAKQKFARKMPGRIVGLTRDVDDNRGYVLTLQTREQHIRRDKATSNICTNEGLCATRATIYLSLIGPQGLRDIGEACLRRAAYLKTQLAEIQGFHVPHPGPHFKEFAIEVPGDAREFCAYMTRHKILAGLPLSRFDHADTSGLLVAVTECRTQEQLDHYIACAAAYQKENRDAVRALATEHAK